MVTAMSEKPVKCKNLLSESVSFVLIIMSHTSLGWGLFLLFFEEKFDISAFTAGLGP